MKVLLDECVPKRLKRLFINHEVFTVPEAGWPGIKNGELLRKASEKFDIFITVDRNLSFQQNLTNLPLPVIVIHSKSNKLKDIEPLMSHVMQLLQNELKKIIYHVGV